MIGRPELTFPAAEAAFVQRTYEGASVVLEYGSGGSTIVAAELPSVRCFTVESDMNWAGNISSWLDKNVADHDVTMHKANIGETAEWGQPKRFRRSMYFNYAQYPRSVWKLAEFQHPDVVLIDGRFRTACFLTVLTKISRPTTVLFDDYVGRSYHEVVEKFATPVQIVGRMAKFDLVPTRLSLPLYRAMLLSVLSAD